MPRAPVSSLLAVLALVLLAPLARAESGLSDLEMDVMESGETPARAMSRIALPVKPPMQREPSLEAEARGGLPSAEESLFRSAADARIEAPVEVQDPPPPIEGSD
ncbi:MAG: hypothetical protein ACKO4A_08995 [Gammaproteobacteria bacterium]